MSLNVIEKFFVFSVFNAVVKMCLVEIPQALHKILDLPMITDLQKPVLPTRSNQKWEKIKLNVRLYLKDILQVCSNRAIRVRLATSILYDTLMKNCFRTGASLGTNLYTA